MCDLDGAAEFLNRLEENNMSEHHELNGPELLEQFADRMQANGFLIEESMLRKASRQWSLDRQALENGQPAPTVKAIAGKAFNANVVAADFDNNTLTLRPESKGTRIAAGRFHLIPVADAA